MLSWKGLTSGAIRCKHEICNFKLRFELQTPVTSSSERSNSTRQSSSSLRLWQGKTLNGKKKFFWHKKKKSKGLKWIRPKWKAKFWRGRTECAKKDSVNKSLNTLEKVLKFNFNNLENKKSNHKKFTSLLPLLKRFQLMSVPLKTINGSRKLHRKKIGLILQWTLKWWLPSP